MSIAADLLIESFRRDAVDAGQVFVKHDSHAANRDDVPFKVGIEGFHANHTIERPEKLHRCGRNLRPHRAYIPFSGGPFASINSRYWPAAMDRPRSQEMKKDR